jgi:hypothetical protein
MKARKGSRGKMEARYLFRAKNRRQERIELGKAKHARDNEQEPLSDRRIKTAWAKFERGEQEKLGPVERKLITRVLTDEGITSTRGD